MEKINISENTLKKERSFVAIKPDALQRSLIGEIIRRFERTGLKLVALKMIIATKDQCWEHYNKDDAWFEEKGALTIKDRQAANLAIEKPALEYGKDIINFLANFMTCGPIITMIWEGNQAVNVVKKIVGSTEPASSDVGTIRGDFTIDSYNLSSLDERAVRNLIHCSDAPEEAEREIKIWFNENEIISYKHNQSRMLYDINLDGILE